MERQRILVLGAGLVSEPLIRYLLERPYDVTVASLETERVRALMARYDNGTLLELDVQDQTALDNQVRAADLVVSLLPFTFHPDVAKMCIEHGKNMVTTSYVSPAMRALDADAQQAGVLLLNEVGLDPGVDHMSAMQLIHSVQQGGGTVRSFRSYCGGLPAPEANNNPFGYKFSWAPRGVLLASLHGARYLRDGVVVDVAPERLFRDMHIVHVPNGGDFEAYPNRDALAYLDLYDIPDARTMYRGTLRNMGWCDCLYQFRTLGLLDAEETEAWGPTYAQMMAVLTGATPGEDLSRACAAKLGIASSSLPIANLRWLGMLSERPLGSKRISPLNALAEMMFERLQFDAGERDMVVLLHTIDAQFPDGRRKRSTSRLVQTGTPNGDSAMAKGVSLPAAIGARLILEGRIACKGVRVPVLPEIYEPTLQELASEGVSCEESTHALVTG